MQALHGVAVQSNRAQLLRAAALVATANRSTHAPHLPAACSALHEHFPVIPEAIREYIEEVKAQLEEVTLSPGGQTSAGDRCLCVCCACCACCAGCWHNRDVAVQGTDEIEVGPPSSHTVPSSLPHSQTCPWRRRRRS